jgi:hypothetical protein
MSQGVSVKPIIPAVLAAVVLCVASAAHADWNHMRIDTTYPVWHEWGYGNDSVDDEIYFTHRDANGVRSPTGFGDQIIANPHVQYNDNGDWLIMGYGENTFTDTNYPNTDPTDDIADSIYVFKRLAVNGQYVVPSTQAMKFTPGTQPLGYLGAGAAIAKTTTTTSAGYKYFSIMPVSVPSQNIGWASWAVSSDGETWYFVDSTGAGLTTDARQSFHLLQNTDPSVDFNGSFTDSNGVKEDRGFAHNAMVYNPYDGYFYIAQGYSNPCGINAWWWRIKFNSANAFGLTPNGAGRFNVELLQTGATNDDDYYTVTDGVFNGGAICPRAPRIFDANGQYLGAADPMDLALLTNSDGSFNSFLFVYAAGIDFNNPPYTQQTYYIRAAQPTSSTGNLVWQMGSPYNGPKNLDFSLVNGQGYAECSAGGGYYLGVAQMGNQADGSPNLFAFINTYNPYSPIVDPTAGNCGGQWSGLLPVHLTLDMTTP